MNITKLEEIISKDKIKYDEPLKNHTSFRTGGPADVLISVSDVRELLCVLKFVEDEKIPYFLLGNGSNVLASDAGFRGAIIKLEGEFLEVKTDGECVSAGTGVTLSKLANAAMNASLSGLEFASGIPGTLGGALFMNAGAYGGDMCRVVTKVKALDVEALKNGAKNPEDAILEISNEDMKFGYRRSVLKEKGYVALSCEMKLEKSDSAKIKETMLDLNKRRKEKQPLEFPSAGSTFKRPEGYFAGKLIEDAGLGGYTIGGAQVSEKHKGFIINIGNASSKDIKSLMDYVTETVKNQSGVTLEPEVIFLGSFDI